MGACRSQSRRDDAPKGLLIDPTDCRFSAQLSESLQVISVGNCLIMLILILKGDRMSQKPAWLLVFQVIITLGFCRPAWAASPELHCTNMSHFSLGMVTLIRPDVPMDCADLEVMNSLYGDVIAMSPFSVVKPTYLLGVNEMPPTVGDYDANYDTIHIGYNPQNVQEVAMQKVAFAHETGHSIFQELLDQKIEFYREYRKVRSIHNDFVRNFVAPIAREMSKDPRCFKDSSFCSSKVSELQAQAEKAPQGDAELKAFADAHGQENAFIDGVVAPYNELFADITAAVFFEDSDITARHLVILRQGDSACRSFSQPLPANFHTNDPHCSLSAVRVRLWNNWISNRLNNKKKLLEDIAEIFVSEIEKDLQRPAGQARTSSDIVADLEGLLGI